MLSIVRTLIRVVDIGPAPFTCPGYICQRIAYSQGGYERNLYRAWRRTRRRQSRQPCDGYWPLMSSFIGQALTDELQFLLSELDSVRHSLTYRTQSRPARSFSIGMMASSHELRLPPRLPSLE